MIIEGRMKERERENGGIKEDVNKKRNCAYINHNFSDIDGKI